MDLKETWNGSKIKSLYFSVDSFFYSSFYVKHQIESLGLLVKMAFVGTNFESTIRYLENDSESIQNGEKSYLILHYTPSLITHLYNLTTVKFDPCDQQWTSTHHSNATLSPNCLYEYNRFAKVKALNSLK